MVLWMNHAVRAFLVFENYIVAQILRSPGFHHVVRRIHRRVQDYQHGRNPHEPLRPGEATELPRSSLTSPFMKHFIEELRNQFRGTPTNPPPPTRPTRKPR